eukprot:3984923-Alexandrium_andersonii.AAC.1
MPLSTKGRFLAMGVPLKPFSRNVQCPFEDALGSVGERGLKELSGNAMRGHIISALLAYVLANVRRKATRPSFGRSMTVSHADTFDEALAEDLFGSGGPAASSSGSGR